MALAEMRGPDRSFCPSEAARLLTDDWRALMPEIRWVAAAMPAEGTLIATQKGHPVIADKARGPIRLALPAGQGARGC